MAFFGQKKRFFGDGGSVTLDHLLHFFLETRHFSSHSRTSGSQLGGRRSIFEINLRRCLWFKLEMERPFDDAAMLRFIRDCLFWSNSPLQNEFSSSLQEFIAERIASRESEWFPCITRDLHSLSVKLADTQTKVIELEQRIDALLTSAANATAATDHRADILQSSRENATQAAVSERGRLGHELLQCYVLLNDFAQVSSQQPPSHFQFSQQQPQPQPQPSPSSYPPYSQSNNQPYPLQQPSRQAPPLDPSMKPANPMNEANSVNSVNLRAGTFEIPGCRVERLRKLI